MDLQIENKKIFSYIFILISIFILIFFTRSQFYNMQILWDNVEKKELELYELRLEQEKLSNIIQDGKNNLDLEKYKNTFKDSEFLDYIYSTIEDNILSAKTIKIRSIFIDKPKLNEFGFNQVDINLNLISPDIRTFFEFLDKLMSKEAKYKIFISDLNLENLDSENNFNIFLPLRIFYK